MIVRLIVAVIIVGLLSAGIAVGVVYNWVHQVPDDGAVDATLFTVSQGEAFMRVVNRLADEQLVDHPRSIVMYGLVRRYDRQIKAGTYRLARNQSARTILDRLVEGDVYKVTVTVPEGFMQNEIARTIARTIDVDSTAVVAAVNDSVFMRSLGVEASSLEGYLFPDTYHLPWGIDATGVVTTMVHALGRVFDDASVNRAQRIGMTKHEVLTLASIIEAECRLTEEQTAVSAVYHNRLRRGMRLEADPTVAYAKGMYRGRLFYKDLEIDSPYNTYRNTGLPPGPICSPGAGAIHAALYPDTTSKAIYFVARGDGGHVFSTNLKDHLTAVKAMHKMREAERKAPSRR